MDDDFTTEEEAVLDALFADLKNNESKSGEKTSTVADNGLLLHTHQTGIHILSPFYTRAH